MSARKPGSLVVAPSSKPGNGTLWRDIHLVDGAFSPAYVGEAIESDARLFAAAPDLLAALIDVMSDPYFARAATRYGHARAAIAKAGGAL